MTAEETIQQQLAGKFPFLADKIRVQRTRRIWAETSAEHFDEVFKYLVEELHFPMLCALTGLDEGANFGLLYHLAQENGITLHLKVAIPREKPAWKSVINFFPGNELCEREVADLFGITFESVSALGNCAGFFSGFLPSFCRIWSCDCSVCRISCNFRRRCSRVANSAGK